MNLNSAKQKSSEILGSLNNLRQNLYNEKPDELTQKVSFYKRMIENLDRTIEKIYKPAFVKTLQSIELMKHYTQAMLSILYKYRNESKEFLYNRLSKVIDAISGISDEVAPYQGAKGVGRNLPKYKLSI